MYLDIYKDRDTKKSNNKIIEPFDGIRKDNSKLIFHILLGIIIIDIVMEYIC